MEGGRGRPRRPDKFDVLFEELLLVVLSKFTLKSLGNGACVSRKWKALIYSNRLIHSKSQESWFVLRQQLTWYGPQLLCYDPSSGDSYNTKLFPPITRHAIQPLASSNGLVCWRLFRNDRYLTCVINNPLVPSFECIQPPDLPLEYTYIRFNRKKVEANHVLLFEASKTSRQSYTIVVQGYVYKSTQGEWKAIRGWMEYRHMNLGVLIGDQVFVSELGVGIWRYDLNNALPSMFFPYAEENRMDRTCKHRYLLDVHGRLGRLDRTDDRRGLQLMVLDQATQTWDEKGLVVSTGKYCLDTLSMIGSNKLIMTEFDEPFVHFVLGLDNGQCEMKRIDQVDLPKKISVPGFEFEPSFHNKLPKGLPKKSAVIFQFFLS